MQEYVIIVAGGTGSRMQSILPKQFLDLSGMPVLAHTIKKFYSYNPAIGIILVLNKDYIDYWKEVCRTIHFDIPHHTISGGEQRFHSVKNGLAEIVSTHAVVAIHDAVRPLVSHNTIGSCFSIARESGIAVPVIPVHDSLRKVDGGISEPVSRELYRIVQTPQCFEINLLRRAYEAEFNPAFTDDASVVEAAGHKIILVEGNRDNFKITTQEDLVLAKNLISE